MISFLENDTLSARLIYPISPLPGGWYSTYGCALVFLGFRVLRSFLAIMSYVASVRRGTNLLLPRWFEKCRVQEKEDNYGVYSSVERPKHPAPPYPTPLIPARQSHDRLRNRFSWMVSRRTYKRTSNYIFRSNCVDSLLLSTFRCPNYKYHNKTTAHGQLQQQTTVLLSERSLTDL